LAARYGGEEFALILPATDQAGALEVARRLRDDLAVAAIPHPSRIGGVVTVSIGVATTNSGQAATAESLVSAADAGIYLAKRAGRNHIEAVLVSDVGI